ncbi:LysR substrate-binding domain-containing protein [Rugamonas apoptosis]|uniref:LysR family transcriptional regulator n=1 Tax=Rugamonas apoptosis TaxID=2758570 RepID=A0A7W2IL02_9BURK|nr:LysR substrate-binding domain-containing protein [Rugamonas apoptosis]MBA5687932.1 LysR family transcriptional regulator [Rugamonas apoptosis]
MSDKLRSMQVFVVAATASSLAAAGRVLDMSAVMVGKHVSALEQQLGASLLERTTRKLTLTEIGASYLERCRDVLASVEAADHVAETLRAVPQGNLRITAPVAYGAQRLVPVIHAYTATYPLVHVDLVLNDRVVNLAEEGIDVAIRSGKLADTGLIARPLARSRMLAAASPNYLERHGVPHHPLDLEQHNCLSFDTWGVDHRWRFSQGETMVAVRAQGNFISNHGHALLAAGLAGMGVVMQNDSLLAEHLHSGALVHLLPDWELPSRAVHIVRRPEPRPSAKVRSFVDFALARLG